MIYISPSIFFKTDSDVEIRSPTKASFLDVTNMDGLSLNLTEWYTSNDNIDK